MEKKVVKIYRKNMIIQLNLISCTREDVLTFLLTYEALYNRNHSQGRTSNLNRAAYNSRKHELQKKTRNSTHLLYSLKTLLKKLLAGGSFDLPTSGLWPQHASAAPSCSTV